MRLGLIHINMRPMDTPDALVQAAHTATIRLATRIVILPQRNPCCADPRGSRLERRHEIRRS